MPNFLKNVGLDFFLDNEDTQVGFVGYLAQNGKAITGYYGFPSLFNDMGSIDIFLKTERNDEGNLAVAGLDTHCSGADFWELRNTGMDITPKDALPTERVFMFKNHETGSGLIPIHLVNGDVLPSFLEDDIVKMQMCAFPLDMHYFADEDDYADHQPKAKDGNKWLLDDGALFPAGFLGNHDPEKNIEDTDYSTDDQVLFCGTVKKLYLGSFEFDGKKDNTYILCIIDTHYGELQLAHTIEQIKPEQRENVKIGSVVCGTCVLSGDVAILDYEKGIVKDFENNLRLLRQVIVKGEAERMRPLLSDDTVYISDSSEKTYKGVDEIIERLNYINDCQKDKVFATLATITQVNCEDLEYSVGTRCLSISYETESDYEAIAFMDITESGDISRIYITTDERYKFSADEKIVDKSILEDIKIPESVIELMYNRAEFHGMVDNATMDDLIEGYSYNSVWQNNAERMLNILMREPRPDIDTNIKNLFGYLFAKAIEMTFNENKSKLHNFTLSASYSPSEAFEGEISSTLSESQHQKIVYAMELGTQFYKDFENFVVCIEPENKEFINILTDALIVVQRIGETYALKYMQ